MRCRQPLDTGSNPSCRRTGLWSLHNNINNIAYRLSMPHLIHTSSFQYLTVNGQNTCIKRLPQTKKTEVMSRLLLSHLAAPQIDAVLLSTLGREGEKLFSLLFSVELALRLPRVDQFSI